MKGGKIQDPRRETPSGHVTTRPTPCIRAEGSLGMGEPGAQEKAFRRECTPLEELEVMSSLYWEEGVWEKGALFHTILFMEEGVLK